MSERATRRSWSELLGRVLLVVGAVLVMLSMPLVIGIPNFSDCTASPMCADPMSAEVARSQRWLLWSWPGAAVMLAVLTVRWPRAWLVFVIVCAGVVALGTLADMAGLSNPYPTIAGVRLPVVSVGFLVWSPSAFVLMIGGLLAWWGSAARSRNELLERSTTGWDLPHSS